MWVWWVNPREYGKELGRFIVRERNREERERELEIYNGSEKNK